MTADLRYVRLYDEHFNSHARVGRDAAGHHSGGHPCHFNSHARVGRDDVELGADVVVKISTHTPV